MEENNQVQNNTEPKEKKPITTIIIVVLIIVILGLTGFIVWDKAIKKDNSTNTTTTTSASGSGDVTTTTSANGDTTTTTAANGDTTTTTAANQKQQDFDLKNFDQAKIIVTNSTTSSGSTASAPKCDTYKLSDNDNSYNFKSQISSDKKSVNVTIDWSKFWHEWDDESLSSNGSITYTINNFQGTVEKVFIDSFGNGLGNTTVFYVMSNGTVEYTPIHHSLKNNGMKSTSGLKSYGTIKNVSGITQLSSGDCLYKNGEGNVAAVYGFKADGSFYYISGLISDSKYYSE